MHDLENIKIITLICISEEMFCDLPHLKRHLTEYYLGGPKEYQLEFDLSYLPVLNRVFDEIIFQNGLQNVSFRFPLHCNYESYKKAFTLKGPK